MSECTNVPVVFVVDDDPLVQESLDSLFRSIDLQVETFGAASEFMKKTLPDVPSCLVVDIRLPGLGGLEFQKALADAGNHIPIIFMTGDGDIPMTVKAMKAGAIDFLTKPFREQDMLNAIRVALEKDRSRREQDEKTSDLRKSYDSL